jgi:hypothetical protein
MTKGDTMREYAVEVELAYYATIFVEANSPEEAEQIVMESDKFLPNYKVLAYGKEREFGNVEFMGVGDVVNG